MTLTATSKTTISSGRLYTRAMLVKLFIGAWGNTVQLPKELVAEFSHLHSADSKFHKLTQYKVDPSYLEPMRESARALRGLHAKLTAPWMDDATRILSVNGHPFYKRKMREALDTHRENVREFVENVYETAVAEAKTALNGLAKYVDYPHPEVIRHEYACGLRYREIPKSEDFRVDLAIDEVAEIISDNASDDFVALETATKHAYRELHRIVQHMVTRLTLFNRIEYTDPATGRVKEKEENGFHRTLVTNVEDLARILPGLNILEDPLLDALGRELQTELCRFSAKELKHDDAARETTLEAAESVLAKVAAYI